MRFRYLFFMVALCSCLTACGPTPPPVSESASITSSNSVIPDAVELNSVKCTYVVPTGERGTFYALTSNGKSQEFTANETVYSSAEYTLVVDQQALPDGIGNDFRSLPDDAYALRSFLVSKYGVEITNTHIVSSDEAVFEISVNKDDYSYTGRMGVSLINRTQLFVYQITWDSQSVPEDIQHQLAKMVTDTFNRRVFESASTDTSVENPNSGISKVYIPLANTSYDILIPGSAYIKNVGNTSEGYDIWYGKTISASIQRFDIGQVDLSITEYNLDLVDYQKALIPTSGNYENFKISSPPSKFLDVESGFSKKLSYVWGTDVKTYVDLYVFADNEGFTLITVKSPEPIPDEFTSNQMVFVLESERKTNGELNTIPQALTSSNAPEDSVNPLHLDASALKYLRNISGDYMESSFGETNVSDGFMVKQLYYKDIFQNVLLPFTSSMDVPEGSTETASSTWVPYNEDPVDSNQVSISYTLFSSDPLSTNIEEGELPTGIDTYGFTNALQNVAGDFFSEMEANNVYPSSDSENISTTVYQRQFSYRCNDSVTNKSYTKNVAIFIKSMGDDKYQENSRNYFSSVMVWGSQAPSSQVSKFQQAFESVVKQVQ